MKKLIAFALSAALLVGSAAALTPEEAFPHQKAYPGYADVTEGAWYGAAARTCYEVGLITGTDRGFEPGKTLTVGEVAAIAARMNEALTGDAIPMVTPGPGETLPWYTSYVRYLEQLGVDMPDGGKNATRLEFLTMLAAILPEALLTPINAVTALPDTDDPDVLAFYNAGILNGTDDYGTFRPDRTLTRAEAAAMVARVVRPEQRLTFTLADYAPFIAAGLSPADALFTGDGGTVTAGQYLPVVAALIDHLEAACAQAGMEFNWFNTYGEETFLDYVKNEAMAAFGVERKLGTDLYQNFDVQVFYSRLIDLRSADTP